MPGGSISLAATADTSRIEAPVTWKTYLMCAFAAFGGIFFGYDSGYISGVQGMAYFIKTIDGPNAGSSLTGWKSSLIVSILSAGTFFGALIAGDLADRIGRRLTIILGCFIFCAGVILQTASAGLTLLVIGRLIAGFGVGFVSAIIILYMSEIAPRKVRGAIVSAYQFNITIGLFLASGVTYGTSDRNDSGSYRIPIALQMLWAIVLATGLFLLPETPRFWVKRGDIEKARGVLARLRSQDGHSDYVESELAEIVANLEYERKLIPPTSWFGSWAQCFSGSVFKPNSNLRRVILGTSLQMMQQWTGVNFIFYFGTPFFQRIAPNANPFVISLATTLTNVLSTPISFYTIERFGRRPLLIWGALGMLICEFITAIIGVTVADNNTNNHSATIAQISFICIYIFFFASTWGPGAWVCIGEIFPLPIRSRGVSLSTASNWLWNCIIAVITPYLVNEGPHYANLKSRVFFLWGSLCTCCFFYAYFLVYETKGLSLEQVDKMMEETTPRTSSKWVPHTTFASEMGLTREGELVTETVVVLDKDKNSASYVVSG